MSTPADWQPGAQRTLLHTPIFEVKGIEFRHPQRDCTNEFVVIDCSDWVVVIAVTPEHQVVLVRQYRFGTAAGSLELPGGIIDHGEPPIEAAMRELQEETGFSGGRARLLGWTHPNPAIQTNRNHMVLIEGVARTGALAWDEHEELETLLWPVEEAVRAATDGRITHALMINALLLYDNHRRNSAGHAGSGV